MKIRNGFVSNSSSSSFLIAFNKMPESRDDIKELFFPNMKESEEIHGYQRGLSIGEAVDRIWHKIATSSKEFNSIASFTEDDITRNFDDLAWDEVSNELKYREFPTSKSYYEEYDKIYVEKTRGCFTAYMHSFVDSRFFENGGVMIEVEFGDECDYPDDIIEHSDIFKKVMCKKCSHH